MIYTTTRDGQAVVTLDHDDHGAEVDAALEKIRRGILELDRHYYSVGPAQHAKARAMAGHLMAMIEEE